MHASFSIQAPEESFTYVGEQIYNSPYTNTTRVKLVTRRMSKHLKNFHIFSMKYLLFLLLFYIIFINLSPRMLEFKLHLLKKINPISHNS